MTAMELAARPTRIGIWTRAILLASGHDEDLLHQCPRDEIRTAWYRGFVVICSFFFKTFLFGLLGHRLLTDDGTVHPAIVAGALFISAMITGIDIVFFIRPGFRAGGLRNLARGGGIDLQYGDWRARLTDGTSSGLRYLLGAAIAALLGVAAGLNFYHTDIVADVSHRDQEQNATLITQVMNRVDAEDRMSAQLVERAQKRVDTIETERAATRRYLRGLTAWRNKARARQAQEALPILESDLKTATADLNRFREDLEQRRARRDESIQNEIRNSPARIDRATGLLAQLSALERLARSNWLIAAVIVLIDVIAFALEMVPILIARTSQESTYSLLVARDSFLRVTGVADELEDFINRRERNRSGRRLAPVGAGASQGEVTMFPSAQSQATPAAQGKRPRGRPRKDGMNGASPSPAGEPKQGPENDNERQ